MTKYRHHPGHPLADEKGWVELNDEYWANLPDIDSCGRPYTKSDPSLHIISDTMEPTWHMADGNYYSSKAEFRRATKRAGCIEVGNDPSIMRPKPRKMLSKQERIEHIKHAIHTLSNKS